MYQEIDGTLAISVNDWMEAGLSYKQFNHASYRNNLTIVRRGINGNTLIDVNSIKRLDQLRKIEAAYGKISTKRRHMTFYVEIDTAAREFYAQHRTGAGRMLKAERIKELVNQASILEALKRGLETQQAARARVGQKVKMGEFWRNAVDFYETQLDEYPCKVISNARSLERVFKKYLKEGYEGLLHGNEGNDSARKVSMAMEKLFLAIWRMNGKPFVTEVLDLYYEFLNGGQDLYDKETGEVFRPQDFCYKGRSMDVSEATVWNYLKNAINETAIYADRNGQFDYQNSKRPKQHRHLPNFSLSKISMDDCVISRKAFGNKWVARYMAVEVLSGYWFMPAYIVGKPTHETVMQSFRNMFIELTQLGLPLPGELEVEHHLMKDLDWLDELFPIVRFCQSATEKRAEHAIRALKYGASHRNGNTRGRWFAKHEAFKSVRYKKSGDFIEPEYQAQTIVANDLRDIEQHNNALHPNQKRFPGMTRKDVMLQNYNKKLRKLENFYLYKYIGNSTDCTIYNNDYIKAANSEFELLDFNDLDKLRPNNNKVTAFWLPEEDGSVQRCYIYQGDTYIGEAINRRNFDYNESAIERTEADNENMLHQNKRNAKFDKVIRDRREDIPKVGKISKEETDEYKNLVPEDIIVGTQPKMDEPEWMNEDIEADGNFDFDLSKSANKSI